MAVHRHSIAHVSAEERSSEHKSTQAYPSVIAPNVLRVACFGEASTGKLNRFGLTHATCLLSYAALRFNATTSFKFLHTTSSKQNENSPSDSDSRSGHPAG